MNLLLKIIRAFCFYDITMNRKKIYRYFLSDLKKEEQEPLTKEFYTSLQPLEKQLVDMDLESYLVKGTNNTVIASEKYNYSESSIKRIKMKTKEKLKDWVLINFINGRC